VDSDTGLCSESDVFIGNGEYSLKAGRDMPRRQLTQISSHRNLLYLTGRVSFLSSPHHRLFEHQILKYLESAISVSIGANLLVNGLSAQISRYTNSVSSQAVVKAGPLNLLSVTKAPAVLKSLREAYAKVISEIMVFALIITCVAVLIACGMKWVNIKEVSARRKQKTADLSVSLETISPQGSAKDQIGRAVVDHV